MGLAQDRGRAGEALAAAFLEMQGCITIARNTRLGGVEVDLVVDDGPTRVLVEVRMRSRGDFGGAAATIDRFKQQRLVRAAQALSQQGFARVRIDVVAIDLESGEVRLVRYRNAVTDSP